MEMYGRSTPEFPHTSTFAVAAVSGLALMVGVYLQAALCPVCYASDD